MNETTRLIKSKGYTLSEFLKSSGISLRTYRRWERKHNANNGTLDRLINELEKIV